MLIAKKIDLYDIPILKQLTPALNRFVETNLKKEYLDVKKKNKNQIFSMLSKNSNLDNISEVVKLIKKINRLFGAKMLCENPTEFIRSVSLLRYSPKFLYLGGKAELEKLCQNYKINKSNYYADMASTLLISSIYDHYLLPINLAWKFLCILPFGILCYLLESWFIKQDLDNFIITLKLYPYHYSKCYNNLTQLLDKDCFLNLYLNSLFNRQIISTLIIVITWFMIEKIILRGKLKSKANLILKKEVAGSNNY